MNNRSIISGVDWWTIIMFICIALFGWMNIYGSSYSFDQTSIWDFSNRAGKQLVWILTALFLGGVILMIEERVYDVLGYIFYGAMILLLVITPIFARDIKGSLSWLTLGPVSIQPAEFAKCFTAIALAKFMSRYGYKVRDLRDLLVPFGLIGLPILIIMLAQRETGSALVFLSFLLVFYRQGMTGYVLSWGVVSIILFIIVIRFGEIALPFGTGNVGLLASTLLIHALIMALISLRERDVKSMSILGGVVAICYGIGLIINIWTNVNFNYIILYYSQCPAGHLLVSLLFLHKKRSNYLLPFFAISRRFSRIFLSLSIFANFSALAFSFFFALVSLYNL